MSVVKNKRSLSRLEFYNNARKLRIDLTNWLLRDFGIRDRVYKVKGDDELEKTLYAEYPKWFIEHTRKSILTILTNLMLNITAANSIYPINLMEVDIRRGLQDKAIANCEQLLQELIYCADIMPLQTSKIEPYAEIIDKEIALLKGWRKTTNDIGKRIMTKNTKSDNFKRM
ncbi:MAG: hypothetical protein J6A75_00325 [Lachnospiraceae bacterium]|nr:hypothetical protein [Lachnospiraceae bacterium]